MLLRRRFIFFAAEETRVAEEGIQVSWWGKRIGDIGGGGGGVPNGSFFCTRWPSQLLSVVDSIGPKIISCERARKQ